MKFLALTYALLSLSVSAHTVMGPPHMDPQMTSEEYRKILATLPQNKNDDPTISRAIAIGERLSKWINTINANRSADQAIRLTSPETRTGNPIHTPLVYSPIIIQKRLDDTLAGLPVGMKDTLTSNSPLPLNPPVDDKTFIIQARLVDKIYQLGARFKSLDVWRSSYAAQASKDVRGYYYLTQNKITADTLKEVSTLPEAQVPAIKDALAGICLNSNESLKTCQSKVNKAFESNTLPAHFQKYFKTAQNVWNKFFEIPSGARRRDVSWSGNTFTVPFNTPSIARFIPYLQNNIEDEFRFGTWGLKLNFGSFSSGPRLKFEAGVVPHVDSVGGNQITMDSNQPIEEYESQWVIRHEFGHVIGLPDCYHEFFDVKLDAYVNYQLDMTDLMCSRAGNMNERIYLELKNAYDR